MPEVELPSESPKTSRVGQASEVKTTANKIRVKKQPKRAVAKRAVPRGPTNIRTCFQCLCAFLVRRPIPHQTRTRTHRGRCVRSNIAGGDVQVSFERSDCETAKQGLATRSSVADSVVSHCLSPCGDLTPGPLLRAGGNVTSSQKPQENTADENGHSGRVWLRLSASEALEHVLREGAETCEVLGLPRGGVSTRDKGLSTLTRCGLGVRCGPSALAVPDVRGRVGLRQGHDRICLICREEDSPRELSILGCDNVPDYGNE